MPGQEWFGVRRGMKPALLLPGTVGEEPISLQGWKDSNDLAMAYQPPTGAETHLSWLLRICRAPS